MSTTYAPEIPRFVGFFLKCYIGRSCFSWIEISTHVTLKNTVEMYIMLYQVPRKRLPVR